MVVSGALREDRNELHDVIPESLAGGEPALVEYRLQIANSAGRSAGWSSGAVVASGEAPPAVVNPHAEMREKGALITWTRTMAAADVVALTREEILPAGAKQPRKAEVALLEVKASPDPGGTVDPAAVAEHSYHYELRRVRRVLVGGHVYELSSEVVRLDTGVLHDTLPPAVPVELEAIASAEGIALSWQPDSEADLAGYVVYRRSADGEWQRLNEKAVTAPQYTDTTAVKGTSYIYAVSAVDRTGNESGKSRQATEEMR